MATFGILLKSYGPDLPYAERFMASYSKYVQGDIPVYAVVPDEDVPDFTAMMARRGEVLPESLWSEHLVNHPIHGNSPGYINQEIIKLTFYEQGLLENYLCADSEAVFLRPFSRDDFMADSHTPYWFVTEDAELTVDPQYEALYGASRRQSLRTLRRFLDLPEWPFASCHNMAVFSSSVLLSLVTFMRGRGLSYADAMEISPYEFSWYNFWLERDQAIEVTRRDPIFLMLHLEHQHLELALKQVTEADLARGYVGVLINSGFSRQFGLIDHDEEMPRVVGRYTKIPQLARALTERGLRKTPRVRKMLGL